jgi:hypothetical protein
MVLNPFKRIGRRAYAGAGAGDRSCGPRDQQWRLGRGLVADMRMRVRVPGSGGEHVRQGSQRKGRATGEGQEGKVRAQSMIYLGVGVGGYCLLNQSPVPNTVHLRPSSISPLTTPQPRARPRLDFACEHSTHSYPPVSHHPPAISSHPQSVSAGVHNPATSQ